MVITEKDIFMFVFFKENLAKVKFDYILENSKNFEDKIKFLREMLNEVSTKLPPHIWTKIKNKISKTSEPKLFLLQKKNFIQTKSNKNLVLAADSQTNTEILTTDTFIDKDANFIAKVITHSESNNIYLFSKENDKNKKYKIKVNPSGNNFTILDISNPLVINPMQQIDEILITVS